jgi:hypothetical protein
MQANLNQKLLLIVLTYLYFIVSYKISFQDSSFLKIDWEKLVQTFILIVVRYIWMSLDENFKEYMKTKYFEAKDSE